MTILNILYRDEHFVAVDKPPGMIVHRGSNSIGDQPVLLQTLRDQIDCLVYPVHRLDQPTSGVILFGLNPKAAATMVDLFTRRLVAKYYQAFVRGWLHRDMRLRIPLVSSDDDVRSHRSSTISPAKQSAETHLTTIRWYELPNCAETHRTGRFSLVEARPKTGRWHQIRRHLKHIAHPIIGDFRHGDDRYNRWFELNYVTNRLMLAACYLEFRHPFTGQRIAIRAPRGSGFDELVDRMSDFEVPIEADRIPILAYSRRMEACEFRSTIE
ncbi:MAG: pseudouridine synthase [Pirellulaceae bacterium]|nr:pseudouridine synthase [Pirellulaceae bacterium]